MFRLIDQAGCAVEYGVLLEGDDSGKVTSERIFYDLATIQACNWQR